MERKDYLILQALLYLLEKEATAKENSYSKAVLIRDIEEELDK